MDIELKFTPPVYQTDNRIPQQSDKQIEKRTWAIMLQHLDSIKDFFENTDSSHCIVCEDDIIISKNFKNDLTNILNNFNHLKLDILLLGYLLPFKLNTNSYFKPKSYQYYDYPDDLWGSQMYLISRDYAKFLLNKYTIEFALNNLDKPYSPDWVITKNGNRAILYPMIAVEEGSTKTSHEGQNDFHKRCFEANYDANIFI
jgi:hypothetical protein